MLSSDDHPQDEHTEKKTSATKFADVFEKTLAVDNDEVRYSTGSYNRNGVYQEYLYFTREYLG